MGRPGATLLGLNAIVETLDKLGVATRRSWSIQPNLSL